MMSLFRWPALFLCLVVTATSHALVDPSLQVSDVAGRYRHIVTGTITDIDNQDRLLTIDVDQVVAGDFSGDELVVEVPLPEDDGFGGGSGTDLHQEAVAGQVVVAFLGSRGRRGGRGLLYQGMEWHELQVDKADPTRWTWSRGLGDQMKGTFVGDAAQLARLVVDHHEGRDFFPATPFTRFQPERVIGTWRESLRGVAIADVDGDGRPDLIATSDDGCRVYLQADDLTFHDRTEELGLAGTTARSVSVADIDGDRHVDLLFDGQLFVQRDGRFVASEQLPDAAAQDVKVSAFVDLNGDGWTDVLISREGGGLAAWLNPGPGADVFSDATTELGFDTPEAGAGETGFVIPGDWNGDGLTDLFFAAGDGVLLIQHAEGGYRPGPDMPRLSLRTSRRDEPGLTGAGTFAPLWREDSVDLAVPNDSSLALITNQDGDMVDKMRVGNESNIARTRQLATLAEDLNMDGYVDLFTFTRDADRRNIFHTNRGYGSYMVDELYTQHPIIPGDAYETGQWGIAVGDVDGDGATDLLLGGADGKLRLVLNDALAERVPQENDVHQQQVLNRTAIVAIDPTPGRGVVGARITIADADGETITWRRLGDAVLTGCSPLHQARIAVRQPGPIQVTMRWSDGVVASTELVLEPGEVTHVELERPSP